MHFDPATGLMSEFSRGGTNVLLPGGGPRLNLWRAPHEIDDNYASKGWVGVGLDKLQPKVLSAKIKKVSPSLARASFVIQYSGLQGFFVTHSATYTVTGDGSVTVDNSIIPAGPDVNVARIGVRMFLNKKLDNVSYLARGPMENYSDRKRGSDIGLYTSTVTQQMTPYEKPMDCGNHEDMRWVALSGKGEPTLLAIAEGAPMQFSALPYRDEEMAKAAYRVDLPPVSETVLALSSQTLGVGSAGCGPPPLMQYRVPLKATEFSYVLRLLPDGAKDVSEIARELPPQDRVHPVTAIRGKDGSLSSPLAEARLPGRSTARSGRNTPPPSNSAAPAHSICAARTPRVRPSPRQSPWDFSSIGPIGRPVRRTSSAMRASRRRQ